MSVDAWITIAILVLIFITLLTTKLPPATVFLGALTLCVTFDLAPLGRSLHPVGNGLYVGVLTDGPGKLSCSFKGNDSTPIQSRLSSRYLRRSQ